MKIYFNEKVEQLNNPTTVEKVITEINSLLQNTYYFSHLIVDGVEIHNDVESFLEDRLDTIQEIEVIAIPAKEFINGLLLSTEDYITRASHHLTDLAHSFSEPKTEEGWTDLADLFEGVQWLLSMAATIEESIARPSTWEQVTNQMAVLESNLPELEQALVNQDKNKISLIIKENLQPVFEKLKIEITKIIDREGERALLN